MDTVVVVSWGVRTPSLLVDPQTPEKGGNCGPLCAPIVFDNQRRHQNSPVKAV